MVELTSYGLTGLTAILVIAFCFAYGDELPPTREKSSYDLINNTHMNDSPMTETGAKSPRFRRRAAPASLLQKTSSVETGSGAIYADSFQSDRGRVEVFHG
jgi:hypothetical protein